jgi:ABC-2 type transport system permease protein
MFRKELSYYFSTPIAYIVIGLFLLAVSLFLWVIPGQWNVIESGYAQVDGLFLIAPWLLMLVCPALTMRLFAEEKQSGTWLLLRAQPIALWKIVVYKYLAAFVLTVLALVPCIVHYFIVFYMAEPMGNIDGGQFAGSMMGLVFLSSSFIGIGMLCSTLTGSQLVAFILGAVSNFVLYWVVLQDHYRSISRGVVDLRDVVFFLSVAVAAIIVSILIAGRIGKR